MVIRDKSMTEHYIDMVTAGIRNDFADGNGDEPALAVVIDALRNGYDTNQPAINVYSDDGCRIKIRASCGGVCMGVDLVREGDQLRSVASVTGMGRRIYHRCDPHSIEAWRQVFRGWRDIYFFWRIESLTKLGALLADMEAGTYAIDQSQTDCGAVRQDQSTADGRTAQDGV